MPGSARETRVHCAPNPVGGWGTVFRCMPGGWGPPWSDAEWAPSCRASCATLGRGPLPGPRKVRGAPGPSSGHVCRRGVRCPAGSMLLFFPFLLRMKTQKITQNQCLKMNELLLKGKHPEDFHPGDPPRSRSTRSVPSFPDLLGFGFPCPRRPLTPGCVLSARVSIWCSSVF